MKANILWILYHVDLSILALWPSNPYWWMKGKFSIDENFILYKMKPYSTNIKKVNKTWIQHIIFNSINEVDYQNTRKQLEQNKDNMSLKSLRV